MAHLQEVEWVEYFAGLGNLSVIMRSSGYTSLRFDLIDHQQQPHRSSNFMDLSHQSGFGFLGTQQNRFPNCGFPECDLEFYWVHCEALKNHSSDEQPRLACLAMLRCIQDNFASHFGIKCASFSKMNVGTSRRSACSAIGYIAYESVRLANTLLERTGNQISTPKKYNPDFLEELG